jgi:hypothetical protein
MANKNFIVHNGLTVGNVVIDATSANITGVNNLSFASGTNGTLAAGNSNVLVVANGNVAVSSTGNANILVVTGTGANISGTANITGNANVGNIGTGTIIATTANLTTINGALHQNGNSNVNITANSNIVLTAVSNATLTITGTGANISGTANITGNANVGNLGTAGLIVATGNVTGGNLVTSGALSVTGNANVGNLGTAGLIVATGNVTGGNLVTSGALSVTGNANTGNLGTSTIIATTANLTTINSGLLQNGTSNVTIASSGNITLNVTAANNYQFSTGSILPNANGAQNLGGASNYFATVYGKATTAQYADVAELYESDAPYSPGTVLDFGGTHEVTICITQMSTRVAGVVSTNPALRMNSTLEADNKIELALLGRVPTRVVGPVAKGDMMVSAGNGHAMACSSPVIGSVIGKALEDFAGAEGIIEIVVGRV